MEIKQTHEIITITDPNIEPFYVTKDSYCYTIYEKINKGKGYNKVIGHYTDIGSVLKKLAHSQIRYKLKYNSVKEFLDTYNELQQNIEKLFKDLKI